MNRVLHNPLNGRLTFARNTPRRSYEDAKSQKDSYYWSATENNSNNAWYVHFGNGTVNNNNKNNSYVVRPVAAYDGLSSDFLTSVEEAYADCLHGKMSSKQALEYMQEATGDLPRLAWELYSGTYKPTTSTCFIVQYPKLREVFAASFRDRIVHHWICLRLEPLFEARFVSQGNVSFNCRKGYGTDAAVRSVVDGMYRVSNGYQREAWVFKGDLSGFFMSIDKHLLWYLLERFISRRYHGNYKDILLRITQAVVMHHPEEDCLLNSRITLWQGLTPNKSLFTCDKTKGEPIGNLTTQLFANFLMSFFDQYIIRVFSGRRYSYTRFVDDWTLICDDKAFLLQAIPKMEEFLRDKLQLTMHSDKRYLQPVSHGVSFVGTYIKPGRLYLSNRTWARFAERALGFRRLMDNKDELSTLDCKRIEQVINSYLGFCNGKKTYKKRKEILDMMGCRLYKYFFIRGHYGSIRARARYRELKPPYQIAA